MKYPLFAAFAAAITVQAQDVIRPRGAGRPSSSDSSSLRSESAQEVNRSSRGRDGRISFASDKPWKASRWYVVGRIQGDNEIRWIDGESTRLSALDSRCRGEGRNVYNLNRGSRDEEVMEILVNDGWIAIEVTPVYLNERFEISPSNNGSDECKRSFELSYSWKGGRGGVSPVLFLGPDNNRYFGQEFSIRAAKRDERADIQLDLLLGYWMATLPNAAAGNASLKLGPVAVARGEWLLPWARGIGFQMNLEQSVASFGGSEKQSALLADWGASMFVQYIMPWKDGLQMRASAGYRQHLADDNRDVPTIADNNRDAKYLTLGGTMNLYFARRWLVGADVLYGPSTSLGGKDVKQGYLSYTGRVGFRMTAALIWLLEAGQRSYSATGSENEKMTQIQTGLRFEL